MKSTFSFQTSTRNTNEAVLSESIWGLFPENPLSTADEEFPAI
jgi:hypothetical protein